MGKLNRLRDGLADALIEQPNVTGSLQPVVLKAAWVSSMCLEQLSSCRFFIVEVFSKGCAVCDAAMKCSADTTRYFTYESILHFLARTAML